MDVWVLTHLPDCGNYADESEKIDADNSPCNSKDGCWHCEHERDGFVEGVFASETLAERYIADCVTDEPLRGKVPVTTDKGRIIAYYLYFGESSDEVDMFLLQQHSISVAIL